jgi:hypothetical protein
MIALKLYSCTNILQWVCCVYVGGVKSKDRAGENSRIGVLTSQPWPNLYCKTCAGKDKRRYLPIQIQTYTHPSVVDPDDISKSGTDF